MLAVHFWQSISSIKTELIPLHHTYTPNTVGIELNHISDLATFYMSDAIRKPTFLFKHTHTFPCSTLLEMMMCVCPMQHAGVACINFATFGGLILKPELSCSIAIIHLLG
jgi:hypothetical protein